MSERHVSEPVERCQLDLGRVAAVRLELLGVEPELLGQAQAISLADGLGGIGERPMLALREPSLGPVFGIKGGGTGGGRAQLAPMELINLYFTSDIHAIGAANNLLAAVVESHLLHGKLYGYTFGLGC